MSTIADQLYKAAESAAAIAGGGGDDNTPPNAGGFNLVKRGVDYVALDNSGKEIARSQDQNTAMQRAKSYLRNPPSPVQAQPSEAMAPGAEVSENPVIPQQNYPANPYQLNQQLQPVQPRQPGQFDATPMQTRMPQASTIDPAQAVLQGAAQTAGAAAVTPQGTTTATTGAVPGQEAPEEQRRRGRSSWEAPGEAVQFTQEDFYPNPQDPFAGQYSTGVEYVARQGRMPMGALSKAAAALQDRQLQLDQKRQEFIDDLYKPIKTASPYQQNFNAIVNKQREDFVKSVADAYTGGDVNKAYREIFASPQLRTQWRQINADLEALGQYGADIFATAESFLKEGAKGTLEDSTPEMLGLARDIVNGMGGYATTGGVGGDFSKLTKDIVKFRDLVSRNTYFKNNIVPMVEKLAERIPVGGMDPETGQPYNVPYKLDKNGRYVFITQGHLDTFRNQIKEQALVLTYDLGYGRGATMDERLKDNTEFLYNMLGKRYDLKTTVEDTYANISRGGGAGDTTTVKISGIEKSKAFDSPAEDVMRAKLTQVSGKKPEEIQKYWTFTKDGQDVPMFAKYIELREDGKYYVSGYSYQKTEKGTDGTSVKTSFKIPSGAVNIEMADQQASMDQTLKKVPVSVPIEGNEASFRSLIGDVDYTTPFVEWQSQARVAYEQMPKGKSRTSAEQAAQSSFEQAFPSETPPVPGAKKARDGKWYVQKDGKTYLVNQ